jgi:hypothetical protein
MKSDAATCRRGHGSSPRLAVGIALFLLVSLVSFGDPPAWWSNPQRPVLKSGAQPNDYAAANQGQVKNIAVAAIEEFRLHLPGGTGDTLDQLTLTLSGTTALTNDFAAVNLGQLKNITQPFYDRLYEAGYSERPLTAGQIYPWDGKEA